MLNISFLCNLPLLKCSAVVKSNIEINDFPKLEVIIFIIGFVLLIVSMFLPVNYILIIKILKICSLSMITISPIVLFINFKSVYGKIEQAKKFDSKSLADIENDVRKERESKRAPKEPINFETEPLDEEGVQKLTTYLKFVSTTPVQDEQVLKGLKSLNKDEINFMIDFCNLQKDQIDSKQISAQCQKIIEIKETIDALENIKKNTKQISNFSIDQILQLLENLSKNFKNKPNIIEDIKKEYTISNIELADINKFLLMLKISNVIALKEFFVKYKIKINSLADFVKNIKQMQDFRFLDQIDEIMNILNKLTGQTMTLDQASQFTKTILDILGKTPNDKYKNLIKEYYDAQSKAKETRDLLQNIFGSDNPDNIQKILSGKNLQKFKVEIQSLCTIANKRKTLLDKYKYSSSQDMEDFINKFTEVLKNKKIKIENKTAINKFINELVKNNKNIKSQINELLKLSEINNLDELINRMKQIFKIIQGLNISTKNIDDLDKYLKNYSSQIDLYNKFKCILSNNLNKEINLKNIIDKLDEFLKKLTDKKIPVNDQIKQYYEQLQKNYQNYEVIKSLGKELQENGDYNNILQVIKKLMKILNDNNIKSLGDALNMCNNLYSQNEKLEAQAKSISELFGKRIDLEELIKILQSMSDDNIKHFEEYVKMSENTIYVLQYEELEKILKSLNISKDDLVTIIKNYNTQEKILNLKKMHELKNSINELFEKIFSNIKQKSLSAISSVAQYTKYNTEEFFNEYVLDNNIKHQLQQISKELKLMQFSGGLGSAIDDIINVNMSLNTLQVTKLDIFNGQFEFNLKIFLREIDPEYLDKSSKFTTQLLRSSSLLKLTEEIVEYENQLGKSVLQVYQEKTNELIEMQKNIKMFAQFFPLKNPEQICQEIIIFYQNFKKFFSDKIKEKTGIETIDDLSLILSKLLSFNKYNMGGITIKEFIEVSGPSLSAIQRLDKLMVYQDALSSLCAPDGYIMKLKKEMNRCQYKGNWKDFLYINHPKLKIIREFLIKCKDVVLLNQIVSPEPSLKHLKCNNLMVLPFLWSSKCKEIEFYIINQNKREKLQNLLKSDFSIDNINFLQLLNDLFDQFEIYKHIATSNFLEYLLLSNNLDTDTINEAVSAGPIFTKCENVFSRKGVLFSQDDGKIIMKFGELPILSSYDIRSKSSSIYNIENNYCLYQSGKIIINPRVEKIESSMDGGIKISNLGHNFFINGISGVTIKILINQIIIENNITKTSPIVIIFNEEFQDCALVKILQKGYTLSIKNELDFMVRFFINSQDITNNKYKYEIRFSGFKSVSVLPKIIKNELVFLVCTENRQLILSGKIFGNIIYENNSIKCNNVTYPISEANEIYIK